MHYVWRVVAQVKRLINDVILPEFFAKFRTSLMSCQCAPNDDFTVIPRRSPRIHVARNNDPSFRFWTFIPTSQIFFLDCLVIFHETTAALQAVSRKQHKRLKYISQKHSEGMSKQAESFRHFWGHFKIFKVRINSCYTWNVLQVRFSELDLELDASFSVERWLQI